MPLYFLYVFDILCIVIELFLRICKILSIRRSLLVGGGGEGGAKIGNLKPTPMVLEVSGPFGSVESNFKRLRSNFGGLVQTILEKAL